MTESIPGLPCMELHKNSFHLVSRPFYPSPPGDWAKPRKQARLDVPRQSKMTAWQPLEAEDLHNVALKRS